VLRGVFVYVSGLGRTITAVVVAAALPAAATVAAPTSLPQPTAQQAAVAASTNPWLTLSAMTSGGAANAAAIAVARDDDGCYRNRNSASQNDDDDGCGLIPFAPLSVVLGTFALGIWILIHEDDSGNPGAAQGVIDGIFPALAIPISPA
jgi:hypothetical protein